MNKKPDVFFTWDIHYACNYNCTYCFLKNEPETAGIKAKYLEPEEWIRIWRDVNRRYGRAHLSVTGGEPFSYPGFIEIVKALSDENTFEFSTNFCFSADEFSAKMDSRKVRINPSFHPEHEAIDKFREKYVRLRDSGFSMGVITMVAYPPFLEEIAKHKAFFEEASIPVIIFPFRGPYCGQTYPDGYTADQREKVRALGVGLPAATEINRKISEKHGSADRTAEAKERKLCMMGMKYAKVVPSGDAFRCCPAVWTPEKKWNSWGALGNLTDGTFNLLKEPAICGAVKPEDCRCYKAMIVGEENEWSKHWGGIKEGQSG